MGEMFNSPQAGGRTDRSSLYAEVTDRIIAELETGRVPWVQPWGSAKAALDLPANALTGRRYSGINILILWDAVIAKGFPHQHWLTFRQSLELGGHVVKGAQGTTVYYADRFIPKGERERAERAGEEPSAIPFLKRFTLFNIAQCEDLPAHLFEPKPIRRESAILPEAEALIRATGADLRIGGDRAFYAPATDHIQVPPPQAFFEPINWHRTALHEISHWSGAKHRLNRDQSGTFGSALYGQEELVAELSSAFLCASLGITPTVRHADYLGAWIDILRENNRAIFHAASRASKAADFILAFGSSDAAQDAESAP
jgi:antirestriction protein ArdC